MSRLPDTLREGGTPSRPTSTAAAMGSSAAAPRWTIAARLHRCWMPPAAGAHRSSWDFSARRPVHQRGETTTSAAACTSSRALTISRVCRLPWILLFKYEDG